MKKKSKTILAPEVKRPRKPRAGTESKPEYYVQPKEFHKDLAEYYASGAEQPPEELAIKVMKIATKLSFYHSFIRYTYREDMVADAVEKMIKAVIAKRYDLAKGNPFSYFTKIAEHAFINRIKKETKQADAVRNYRDKIYHDLEEVNSGWHKTRQIHQQHDEENIFYDDFDDDEFASDIDNLVESTEPKDEELIDIDTDEDRDFQ